MQKNILLTGVGGQGTVLASKLLAAAALNKGLEVMSAETIGMAQKGGSVFSHLRIGEAEGEAICSPMIPKGGADLLLAFEPAEAVRMLGFLKLDGQLVVNSAPVLPVTAALSGSDYTGREMLAYLREHCQNLLIVDGTQAAAELGVPKALNVVMLGAALSSGALDFLTREDLLDAIRAKVRAEYVPINEQALDYCACHHQ